MMLWGYRSPFIEHDPTLAPGEFPPTSFNPGPFTDV